MKHGKLITWLSAALLGISAAAAFSAGILAQAATSPDGLFEYEIKSNEVTILKYLGNAGTVEIPSSIANKTVTKIGDGAFKNATLNTLKVPATVKAIGDEAFYQCYNLSSISDLKVETIGYRAFYTCIDLTEVSLQQAVSIGNAAFSNCWSLESISLPKAKTIGHSVFSQCSSLKTASLPKIATVSDSAFWGCKSLTGISIPAAQTIERAAFSRCTALKTVSLPESVTSIGDSAFSQCTAMTELTITGPAVIQNQAFDNCSALAKVQLSDSSRTVSSGAAFSGCKNLYTVNGETALLTKTDLSGRNYPAFHSKAVQAIRNHFCRSNGVGFIDEFCTKLCTYIVETETDKWMNKALKARQLHDWLIRHCQYEDQANGERESDSENHVASSVFVSYALNVRGEGVGESVCEGFAQAYTMLLSTAEIESYVVSGYTSAFAGHGWNIINIDGKYYEVDVAWDDGTETTAFSTNYTYFLKSDAVVREMHEKNQKAVFGNTQEFSGYRARHTLLDKYHGNVKNIIASCTESYQDYNGDGILEYDFDLDGKWLMNDTNDDQNAFNGMLYFVFGSELNMFQINDRLSEVFYWLHYYHKDYWTFVNTSAPVSQSAAPGSSAQFKVTLFGDNLVYRWYCRAAGSSQWVPADAYNGSSTQVLTVPASSGTNDMQFQCVVWNKNGYYIYSAPVTLTVR